MKCVYIYACVHVRASVLRGCERFGVWKCVSEGVYVCMCVGGGVVE